MRLFLIISCFILVSSSFSWAQVGSEFPMLIGQKVDGKVVDLPESVEGKYTFAT